MSGDYKLSTWAQVLNFVGIMGFTGTFMYAVHLPDSKTTGKLYFDLAQSYFLKSTTNYQLLYSDINFCVRL